LAGGWVRFTDPSPSPLPPQADDSLHAEAGTDVRVDPLREVPGYARGAFLRHHLHPHQEDNLLALHGGRTFYLVNFGWNYPYHIVRLEAGGDILRIPPGTFHRSVSDPDGSVVLNQAVRDEGASVVREFRVYNSRRIPRLFAVTFKTAPLPKLHGLNW
jgi:hypothetical protein